MGAITTGGSRATTVSLPIISVVGFFVASILAGLTYLFFSFFSREFAGIVAGTVLTSASGGVIKYLKDRQLKAESVAATVEHRTVQRFTLKWYVAFLYGTLALIGVTQIFAGFAGFIMPYLVGWDESIVVTMAVMNSYLIWPIFAFVLGRWVGQRCERSCLLLAPIILILVNVLNSLSTLILPESMLIATLGQTRAELIASIRDPSFLGFFFGGITVQILSTLVGYWRGFRSRASVQLLDLLSTLPADTRTTVVDLVYEEADHLMRPALTDSA